MSLTLGCSKKDSANWISTDGVQIYIDGEPMMLTYFDGDTGEYKVEGDLLSADFSECVIALRDCPENREGVHEGDVSIYKNANYFVAFINSFMVMHMDNTEDTTKELTATTKDVSARPLELAKPELYTTLNALKFDPIKAATFDNTIVVKSEERPIIVRNTSITIPSVLTVFKGTRECTQQVDIGGVTVMKYESNNYDFYQYGSNLIKATKGTDVSQYVTLKVLE